jgi:glycosyltransferase involved in cell wall biosynthesis
MSRRTTAITVVVPTRDRRAFLLAALRSILAQRDVDVRVVVVDEASSDGTADAVEALRDARIEVVRHDEPKGVADARNAGLARVTTPWVAFCDDDDLWAPDKLTAQLAAIEGTPGARWACTGSISVDAELVILGHQRPPAPGDNGELLRAGNVIPAGSSSVLAETALVREVGGFDRWPTGVEDYDLWVRLGQWSPLATVDRPLVAYRVWPGSMSTDIDRMRTGRARVVARHRRAVDPARTRELDLRHRQYLARFPLRARDRRTAAREHLRIAWQFRSPRHVVHAVLALAAPDFAERRRARLERAEVPAWWAAAADAWLDELRAQPRVSVG